MHEVTIEQAQKCYDFAQQNHENDITPSARELKTFADKIGMEHDSAENYVANFKSMLQMKLYIEPMTIEATLYYLKRMHDDNGDNGALTLAGALSAVMEHVIHQAKLGIVETELLQEISSLLGDLDISTASTGIDFFNEFEIFVATNSTKQ